VRIAWRQWIAATLLLAAAGARAQDCGSQDKIPPDKRLSNTAHWTTASEDDNFGYDVYRSDKQTGPFARVTKQPILGNGTTAETHTYQFVDSDIDPCKDYWYYIESIASDGTREKFTEAFHAPAKRKPDAAKP